MRFLDRLKTVRGCPLFHATSDDGRVLILSPVGFKFCLPPEVSVPVPESLRLRVPCRKQHISAIIDVVKEIHDLEVVHRDLKIGNIFAVPDPECAAEAPSQSSFAGSHVLVNDLGCATDLNSSASFAGTLHFASDDALIAATNQATKVWKRSDDLVSILKFAFILSTNSSTFSAMKQADSPDSVLKFWQQCLPLAWLSVIDLAKTVDSDSSESSYNAFRTALLRLL